MSATHKLGQKLTIEIAFNGYILRTEDDIQVWLCKSYGELMAKIAERLGDEEEKAARIG